MSMASFDANTRPTISDRWNTCRQSRLSGIHVCGRARFIGLNHWIKPVQAKETGTSKMLEHRSVPF